MSYKTKKNRPCQFKSTIISFHAILTKRKIKEMIRTDNYIGFKQCATSASLPVTSAVRYKRSKRLNVSFYTRSRYNLQSVPPTAAKTRRTSSAKELPIAPVFTDYQTPELYRPLPVEDTVNTVPRLYIKRLFSGPPPQIWSLN